MTPGQQGDDTARRKGRAADRPLAVHAEWRSGPRSRAWDALWRRILEDVFASGEKTEEWAGSDDA
jgi:hypothetical protein